jgi:hypothetical protein
VRAVEPDFQDAVVAATLASERASRAGHAGPGVPTEQGR